MTSASTQRVIALVDMDCFYCQVESRLNPELKGKPVAVVQYYQWKGGGIIAVNYEAKNKGVTRGMRGADAQNLCPNINLVSVPVTRGKADLTKYREASEEVAKIFMEYSDVIQRASIDEAYIDLTKAVNDRISNGLNINEIDAEKLKSTYIIGYSDLKANKEEERKAGVQQWVELIQECTSDSPDFHLTVGGLIVEEMREKILEKTGFHCSAGVAHNKILAKLIAGLHKPQHQTIIPQDNVPELYDSLPVHKIRSLGGKFGRHVAQKLSVKYMSELYRFSLKELQQKFDEKSGLWLYNIARGIELEPVTPRLVPESIGCCKNFRGKEMLVTKKEVKHWIRELSDEISERLWKDLEKNKRRAKLLTVSIGHETTSSKSESLHSYDTNTIADSAFDVLMKFNNAPSSSEVWVPPVQFLGLSAGKFSKEEVGIGAFFKRQPSRERETRPPMATITVEKTEEKPSTSEGSSANSMERSFFLKFLNNRVKQSTEDIARSAEESENPGNPLKGEKTCPCLSSNSSKDEICLPSTSDADVTNETQLCEECEKQIKIIDFFEHLDYHAAVKLHAEINRQTAPDSRKRETPAKAKDVQQKRKRLRSEKEVAKSVRDIKSFFQVVTK